MKKIIILIIVAFAFTACEKETTGGLSKVTNYPLFELEGGDVVFLAKGEAYNEPGIIATENGEEIPVVNSVSGAYRNGDVLDPSVSDCYDLMYTATNADGFDGTAHRTVYVVETGDMVSSIEGLYTSTIVRNGALRFSDLSYVLVWKNDDGTYEFSCGFGGYYEIGTGYGLGYKSGGCIVTANDIASNDFSITDYSNDGFGGDITNATLTVDAATKTMNLVSDWSFGYTFEVELTQVEL
ncbi:DUF5011 domain-containing protein [Bacteroidia bacterium]|nr:DUF5011 domain-containing protein [Bacteroidia bacterium]